MVIEWREDLSIGVAGIDNQHKELFKRVGNFLEAVSQGKGKEEISALLEFLKDYAKVHFAAEEKFMRMHNYAGYQAHKAEHLKFIQELNGLKKEFESTGPAFSLVIQVQNKTVDWLINHISKTDKRLAKL